MTWRRRVYSSVKAIQKSNKFEPRVTILSQSCAAHADGHDGVVGLRLVDGGGAVPVDRHSLLAVVHDVAVISRRKSGLRVYHYKDCTKNMLQKKPVIK